MKIIGKFIPQPALLGVMLILLVSSGFLGPIISLTVPDAFAALSGDTLKGKVIDSSGSPVAGAQVQLLSPAKTMMDVTVTGKDGKFTLDLGVLEAKEMAQLNKFYILVNKKGKKIKKGLDSGASSANGVVSVEDIELE
ncbi:MAG: carboxypeptidase-like regulatory domain-containing protein [Acidiferrobacterales bacterium]